MNIVNIYNYKCIITAWETLHYSRIHCWYNRFAFWKKHRESVEKGVLFFYIFYTWNKTWSRFEEKRLKTNKRGKYRKTHRCIAVAWMFRQQNKIEETLMCDLFWNEIKLDLEFCRKEPINNRKIIGWLLSVEYNPIGAQLRKTNQYAYCILLSNRKKDSLRCQSSNVFLVYRFRIIFFLHSYQVSFVIF